MPPDLPQRRLARARAARRRSRRRRSGRVNSSSTDTSSDSNAIRGASPGVIVSAPSESGVARGSRADRVPAHVLDLAPGGEQLGGEDRLAVHGPQRHVEDRREAVQRVDRAQAPVLLPGLEGLRRDGMRMLVPRADHARSPSRRTSSSGVSSPAACVSRRGSTTTERGHAAGQPLDLVARELLDGLRRRRARAASARARRCVAAHTPAASTSSADVRHQPAVARHERGLREVRAVAQLRLQGGQHGLARDVTGAPDDLEVLAREQLGDRAVDHAAAPGRARRPAARRGRRPCTPGSGLPSSSTRPPSAAPPSTHRDPSGRARGRTRASASVSGPPTQTIIRVEPEPEQPRRGLGHEQLGRAARMLARPALHAALEAVRARRADLHRRAQQLERARRRRQHGRRDLGEIDRHARRALRHVHGRARDQRGVDVEHPRRQRGQRQHAERAVARRRAPSTEATASAAASSAPALKAHRGAFARGLEGDAHLVVGGPLGQQRLVALQRLGGAGLGDLRERRRIVDAGRVDDDRAQARELVELLLVAADHELHARAGADRRRARRRRASARA